MKPLRLSQHARARLADRGAFAWEIEETIRTSPWEPDGVVYATKQIRPIFVDDLEEIVVVTAYVYYL